MIITYALRTWDAESLSNFPKTTQYMVNHVLKLSVSDSKSHVLSIILNGPHFQVFSLSGFSSEITAISLGFY